MQELQDSSMKKMTVENSKKVIDTNLVGTFITCKAAAEIMAEQGYGR